MKMDQLMMLKTKTKRSILVFIYLIEHLKYPYLLWVSYTHNKNLFFTTKTKESVPFVGQYCSDYRRLFLL